MMRSARNETTTREIQPGDTVIKLGPDGAPPISAQLYGASIPDWKHAGRVTGSFITQDAEGVLRGVS